MTEILKPELHYSEKYLSTFVTKKNQKGERYFMNENIPMDRKIQIENSKEIEINDNMSLHGLPRKETNQKNELILLSKSNLLKTQIISNLTSEVNELQGKSFNFDKMLVPYQETIHSTFKNEIDNIRLTNSVLKDFLDEEMIYAKNIITYLSNMIEEFLINEHLFKDLRNKKQMCKYCFK